MLQVELGFKSQSVVEDEDDSEELSQDSEGSDSKSTSDADTGRDTTPADTDPSLHAPHASKYQSRLPRPLHSDPKWTTFLEDVFDVHEPKDLARSGMGSSLLQSEMPLELSLGLR